MGGGMSTMKEEGESIGWKQIQIANWTLYGQSFVELGMLRPQG